MARPLGGDGEGASQVVFLKGDLIFSITQYTRLTPMVQVQVRWIRGQRSQRAKGPGKLNHDSGMVRSTVSRRS